MRTPSHSWTAIQQLDKSHLDTSFGMLDWVEYNSHISVVCS